MLEGNPVSHGTHGHQERLTELGLLQPVRGGQQAAEWQHTAAEEGISKTAEPDNSWQWQMINNGQWPPAAGREVHAGHHEKSSARQVELHWDRLHGEPVEAPSLVVSKTTLHIGISPLQMGGLTR